MGTLVLQAQVMGTVSCPGPQLQSTVPPSGGEEDAPAVPLSLPAGRLSVHLRGITDHACPQGRAGCIFTCIPRAKHTCLWKERKGKKEDLPAQARVGMAGLPSVVNQMLRKTFVIVLEF